MWNETEKGDVDQSNPDNFHTYFILQWLHFRAFCFSSLLRKSKQTEIELFYS